MVAGSGTNVGKTLVSAILTTCLKGEYWKPIESGEKDSTKIKEWIDLPIHPSIYSFAAPLSPHHAARLEEIQIDLGKIKIPQHRSSLIIEGVGGVLVPLTFQATTLDLFKEWNCDWVIVSKNELGSINHTLLTLEVLKQSKVSILGIIFNGEPNLDSERAILQFSNLPQIGRLLPEPNLNQKIIQNYAKVWEPKFFNS